MTDRETQTDIAYRLRNSTAQELIDNIIQAYRDTGLLPVQNAYVSIHNGCVCGCGVVALACAFDPAAQAWLAECRSVDGLSNFHGEHDQLSSFAWQWVTNVFGYRWRSGFLSGFDGTVSLPDLENSPPATSRRFAVDFEIWQSRMLGMQAAAAVDAQLGFHDSPA